MVRQLTVLLCIVEEVNHTRRPFQDEDRIALWCKAPIQKSNNTIHMGQLSQNMNLGSDTGPLDKYPLDVPFLNHLHGNRLCVLETNSRVYSAN